jgi:glycosyltransferase involved in cell wall biosynthesis
LNLNKSIFFLNWVNDLTKKISSLQLAVFPSVWPLEGFGMVLIEAMSLGKPIVCFDSGPYNEIVNSKCALLVKKGDTKELSDAIIKIFSSSQLAKKIGLNGKNRFTRLFTLDKIAKNYYKVLLQAQIRTESDKYK